MQQVDRLAQPRLGDEQLHLLVPEIVVAEGQHVLGLIQVSDLADHEVGKQAEQKLHGRGADRHRGLHQDMKADVDPTVLYRRKNNAFRRSAIVRARMSTARRSNDM